MLKGVHVFRWSDSHHTVKIPEVTKSKVMCTESPSAPVSRVKSRSWSETSWETLLPTYELTCISKISCARHTWACILMCICLWAHAGVNVCCSSFRHQALLWQWRMFFSLFLLYLHCNRGDALKMCSGAVCLFKESHHHPNHTELPLF